MSNPRTAQSTGGLMGKGEPVVASSTPPAPAEQQQQHQVQAHHSTPKSTSHTPKSQNVSPNIIGSHYKVGKKIGEGSFGIIYEGVSLVNHAPCAIKFEPRKSDAPQLRDEFRTYKVMQGVVGIPNVYYFGQEGLHNILCIDLLGPSLEDMFDLCGRKFSVKTVCMVAKQMLTRIQAIHEKNLIYRDIKPDNFLIGRLPRSNEPNADVLNSHSASTPHPASQVFVVDFGMAKQYRDPKNKIHIPFREKKSLSGTARYMSINTHLGREQSRRDDLEALGHVFMYFTLGCLPWQGLKAATNKQKYEKIGEKKQSTAVKDLCEGYPEEFGQFLTYARTLKFEEAPDYDRLRGIFTKVMQKRELVDDGIFDWMLVMDKQRRDRERRKEAERQAAAEAAQAEPQYPSNWGEQPASMQPNHGSYQFTNGSSVNAMSGSQTAGSPVLDASSLANRQSGKVSDRAEEEVVASQPVQELPSSSAPSKVSPAVKKKKKGGLFSCCM